MAGAPCDISIGARVRALFTYDPMTGSVTRRVRTSNRTHAGQTVGHIDSKGYLNVRVDGHTFKLHRVAWLCMTGAWPTNQIDHIDGDKQNNKWSNLRDVEPAANAQNKRTALSTNVSGLLGVGYRRDTGRYWARITVGSKTISLGVHQSAEAAHAAYLSAKRKLHEGNTL